MPPERREDAGRLASCDNAGSPGDHAGERAVFSRAARAGSVRP